jgi:hypothetical protein
VPGPVDYALWFLTALAEAAALVCAWRGRALGKYFTLNLYLLACLFVTVGRYVIFAQYGFISSHYRYFYFLSDALLSICLFCALMGLYSHVFSEMGVSRYLRVGALLLLAGTALVSHQIVAGSGKDGMPALMGSFMVVVETSRNLYFVGLVLTYLLWAAMMKMRETRLRLIQLVASLGIYVSAFAANYALHSLEGSIHKAIWAYLPPLMAIGLPLAWAFTFAKVPEEARLATARVAGSHTK